MLCQGPGNWDHKPAPHLENCLIRWNRLAPSNGSYLLSCSSQLAAQVHRREGTEIKKKSPFVLRKNRKKGDKIRACEDNKTRIKGSSPATLYFCKPTSQNNSSSYFALAFALRIGFNSSSRCPFSLPGFSFCSTCLAHTLFLSVIMPAMPSPPKPLVEKLFKPLGEEKNRVRLKQVSSPPISFFLPDCTDCTVSSSRCYQMQI